jgi:type I restriction enzyme S subunit
MASDWPTALVSSLVVSNRGLAMGPFGSNITRDNFKPEGVPVLRGSSLVNNKFQDHDVVFVTPDKAQSLRSSEAVRGDIVFTHRGTIGQVARIPEDSKYESYIVSQSQMRARFDAEKIDSSFAFYWFCSRDGQLALLANTSQVGVPAIARPISSLGAVCMPVPRLEEQRKIAGVLGTLDDLIEVNRELMADLDELSMALFRAAWDGDTWVQVDEIGEVEMGSSPPGHTYNEEGLGVVFYQGVRDFGDRYPSARVYCTEPKRLAEKGDILIAVRAPIGNTNIAMERTAIGRGLARLRSRTPSTSLRALRADPRTWAPFEGSGTVFASISGPDLKSARVPSVADSRLEEKLAILDRMHEALHAEMSELIGARDELLPLLMSGRLRVGDDAA